MTKPYGKELILDLHDCDPATFTRRSINQYFDQLCELIEMEQCNFHFWDYKGDPHGYSSAPDHLKGTSAIQFITTSNITIHTLDVLKKVYVNIFTCKDLSVNIARGFTEAWFKGKTVNNLGAGDLIIRI